MKGLFALSLLLPAALSLRSPVKRTTTAGNASDVNLAALGPGPRARNRRLGVGIGSSAEDRFREDMAKAEGLPKIQFKCMESFEAERRFQAVCPAECPYMRFDPTRMCHWRCVTEERCRNAPDMPPSIPNAELGMCIVCQVPGCKRCGNMTNVCAECEKGFDFAEGDCRPKMRHAWHVVYACLSTVLLLILWYVICLFMRPVKNEAVLQEAIEYRSKCKTRRSIDMHECYPLSTNLASQCTDSGGVGTLLHFRYQYMVLIWSFSALIILGWPAVAHKRLKAMDALSMAPAHEEVMESCQRLGPGDERAFEHLRIDFLWAVGFLYLLTTVGALYFAWSQRQLRIVEEADTATMADYALLCTGLPTDNWAHTSEHNQGVEEEYLDFFRKNWGEEKVIGVSVVWNMGKRYKDILKTVDACMHKLDTHHSKMVRKSMRLTASPHPLPTMSPIATSDESSEEEVPRTSSMCRRILTMEFLDDSIWVYARLGTGRVKWKVRKLETNEQADLGDDEEYSLARLDRLSTTGKAFVVFNSESDREAALQAASELPAFRGSHKLQLRKLDLEPEAVLWEGYHVSHAEVGGRVLAGVGSICVTIGLWCVCVYGPYAWYTISWTSVAGNSTGGGMESFLLGLIVTIGNQLVRGQCQVISENAGCVSRDVRDMLNVVLYTFSVLVNTILDLWLVTWMAYGWQKDSGVNAMAVVRNPSMQHALFAQLVGYIYPSTIIVPFILEPVFAIILPYMLYMLLIRGRAGHVNRWRAEQAMACPLFDLLRYGDLTINLVLILLLFFLTSVNMWWACLIMLNSCVVIYMWDHYRFLRTSTRTCFGTDVMDICGQYMTAVPCACLASVFAFKLQGGQAMVRNWKRGSFLDYHAEWIICIVAFFVHLIVHVLLLRFLVPRLLSSKRDALNVPYKDVAEVTACNWFNANPVHVLRSMKYYCHSPPHVQYVPGKEYLQKCNPDIHAYYEATTFADETSTLGDIQELVHTEWKNFRRATVLSMGGGGRASPKHQPDSPKGSQDRQSSRTDGSLRSAREDIKH